MESRSTATVAAIRPRLGEGPFELIEVPDMGPRTKPKALGYALPWARGEFVVVYDAEDIPRPQQLRIAAGAFAANAGIDCLQAELVMDNAHESALAAFFTGEYAGQFGIVMPALAHWGFPVPLGGTSNHFRTATLRELGGWDAFNVTEDADLGVRLARRRYRTAMLPSHTYEEAPIGMGAWIRQRTRWMKGWMQTFIAHNRHPVALCRQMGWKGFVAFELYVGSMILSPMLHTAFLLSLLIAALTSTRMPIDIADGRWPEVLVILIIGYGGSFAIVIAGLLRIGQWRLLPLQALLPFYWMLHSVATLRAAAELLRRPHHWEKTTHGVTRVDRTFNTPQAPRPKRRGKPISGRQRSYTAS